jgi:hypothetical protein
LEEVPLAGLGGAPGVFQLLVGGEELAGPDQLEAALERFRQGARLRRRPGGRPSLAGASV